MRAFLPAREVTLRLSSAEVWRLRGGARALTGSGAGLADASAVSWRLPRLSSVVVGSLECPRPHPRGRVRRVPCSHGAASTTTPPDVRASGVRKEWLQASYQKRLLAAFQSTPIPGKTTVIGGHGGIRPTPPPQRAWLQAPGLVPRFRIWPGDLAACPACTIGNVQLAAPWHTGTVGSAVLRACVAGRKAPMPDTSVLPHGAQQQ